MLHNSKDIGACNVRPCLSSCWLRCSSCPVEATVHISVRSMHVQAKAILLGRGCKLCIEQLSADARMDAQ